MTDIIGSTGVGSASQPIYYTGSAFAGVTGIANEYLTNSKVTIMGSDVSLGGSIDTFSGAGTFNGAIVINNTLQVGNPTTNRNMQLHGELRFNGLSNVYLNYVAANSGIHCSTGFYSDSYISASSDARLKKNLKDVHISLADIADAPAVEFDWIDKNKGRGAGSIAQHWQNVLPLNVHRWEDGSLSMEYGNIALISAITIARRVCELEREIKELRNRLPQ